MKFLLIYGSPAAGKLTVAKEIEAITGFKVFHNHLTINCVRPIFEFGTPPFGRLVDAFRLQLITEAALEGVDLIHTFVYSFGYDDPYIERITGAVEENGGEVCLVLLRCDMKELLQRVSEEGRRSHGKVATPEMLRSLHEEHDLVTAYPKRESLVIDNTALSPQETAGRIIDHFDLPRQDRNV